MFLSSVGEFSLALDVNYSVQFQLVILLLLGLVLLCSQMLNQRPLLLGALRFRLVEVISVNRICIVEPTLLGGFK